MSKLIGNRMEKKAQLFLQKKGLTFHAKNYRSPFGEIDLIMTDKETLIFIEVKYRSKNSFGSGIDAVTQTKQNKIKLTADYFLIENKFDKSLRFDIVSISDTKHRTLLNYEWIQNAFY